MSFGKFVMNLIRSSPAISWSRSSRSERRTVRPSGSIELVTVDGLAEEGDLLDPLVGELPGLLDDHVGGRLCSGPRTEGTTQ